MSCRVLLALVLVLFSLSASAENYRRQALVTVHRQPNQETAALELYQNLFKQLQEVAARVGEVGPLYKIDLRSLSWTDLSKFQNPDLLGIGLIEIEGTTQLNVELFAAHAAFIKGFGGLKPVSLARALKGHPIAGCEVLNGNTGKINFIEGED